MGASDDEVRRAEPKGFHHGRGIERWHKREYIGMKKDKQGKLVRVFFLRKK